MTADTNKKEIKIKYHTDIEKIAKINKGDWIDLRAAKDMVIEPHTFAMIPLGVSMKLPEGYEAHILPRSSTFKNFNMIMTNSQGIIDSSYCGDDDQWMMPVYAIGYAVIKKNDRICQFRIVEKQPEIEFTEVESLGEESRGGFGSTGIQ